MKGFAKAYIDDFVVYLKTFEQHLTHLRHFFTRMDDLAITLAPDKAFVGYPTVTLLVQKVDAFGVTSTYECIYALKNLAFPRTLKEMEKYMGAIGFLNDKTPYLAQLPNP
jgi:diaminopimelate decarboxylase